MCALGGTPTAGGLTWPAPSPRLGQGRARNSGSPLLWVPPCPARGRPPSTGLFGRRGRDRQQHGRWHAAALGPPRRVASGSSLAGLGKVYGRADCTRTTTEATWALRAPAERTGKAHAPSSKLTDGTGRENIGAWRALTGAYGWSWGEKNNGEDRARSNGAAVCQGVQPRGRRVACHRWKEAAKPTCAGVAAPAHAGQAHSDIGRLGRPAGTWQGVQWLAALLRLPASPPAKIAAPRMRSVPCGLEHTSWLHGFPADLRRRRPPCTLR